MNYVPSITNQYSSIIELGIRKRQDILNSITQLNSERRKILITNFKNISTFFNQTKNEFAIEQKNFSTFFNIFDFFPIDEMKHSELFSFLLNPFANHGQGKLFLNIFLDKLGIAYSQNDNWQVTNEKDRIDILLKREYPHSIIIIENKSNWAVDQPNQLYRYWLDQIYYFNPNIDYSNKEYLNSYRIIYLTPNESKKLENQSITKPSNITTDILPSIIPMQIESWSFNNELVEIAESGIKKLNHTNTNLITYLKMYISKIKTL